MRIHSLSIRNVRGLEHLELNELPATGVIVIHGDNEQGKSTILDAINVVLTQKHTANNRFTKPLKPVHRDASPEVSLTMTLGPVTFTVAKTWYRGRNATLTITSPQRDSFTGDQAETKLEELIGDHLDTDLLSTLFLRQDDLGASVGAVGIPSLTRALEGSAGEQGTPGDEDSGLIAAARKEFIRYFTLARRDSAGELKVAEDDFSAAEAELAEAITQVSELDSFVQRHDRSIQDRDQAELDLPEAEAEVVELAEKSRVASDAAKKAQHLHEELNRATEALERAQEAKKQRVILSEAVSTAKEELRTRREGLTETSVAAENEEKQLRELGEALIAVRTRAEATATELQQARKAHRLAEASSRRDELATQLAQVSSLNTQITSLREKTGGKKITEKDVREVEDAVAEVTLQRRLREQAAAKLHLSSAKAATISVNGEDWDLDSEATAIELHDGVELVIGDVTARYVAGFADSATGEDLVAAAEQKLEQLLTELGCDDLAAVRHTREVAREDDEKLTTLIRERSAVLSGSDLEEITAEHSRLVEELQDEEISEELTLSTAAQGVRTAEKEQDAVTTEKDKIDAALTPWQERSATLALTALTTRIEAAEDKLQNAEATLAAAEDKVSTLELEAAIISSQDAVAELTLMVSAADAEVAAVDPELAKNLFDGAAARVENLRVKKADAEKQLAELTGRIDMATGAAERREKAEAAWESAQRHLDSVARRAEAARLLFDTLNHHLTLVRARYAQPFADQLARLARTVFGPDVEFTLADDLAVAKRSIGDTTVSLDELSGGAKEQLAILTRFAIAGLVSQESEDGQIPVPVVVDDALGSTDPSRLQLMSTLFTEMGKTGQVIVLTCVPQRYDRVVGRTEYPIEQLKSAGMLL